MKPDKIEKTEDRRLNLTIPEHLWEKLEAEAIRLCVSVPDAVRIALVEKFEEKEKAA